MPDPVIGRGFDAGRLLEAYGRMALALAGELVTRGAAQVVEDHMVAIIDPIYDTAHECTARLRLVEFCDDIRRLTKLPALPEKGRPPAADQCGGVTGMIDDGGAGQV